MTLKIMIVGAGISGLSLAQWLQRFGLDFEIIEKKSSETFVPTGVVLPFNAVRELHALNLFDQLEGKFFQASSIAFSKANSKTIKTADLSVPPFENDQCIALKRQDLEAALQAGLQKKIRYNTEILSVEHIDNAVNVTCTNELLNGSYDLLIAADGINSLVRQQNYEGQETVIDHNVVCWDFISPAPGHGLQPLHMIGHTDLFMIYPISDDALYCYGHAYEDPNNAKFTKNSHENVKRVFAAYGDPLIGVLSRLDEANILTGRLKSVVEPHFFDRRIAFVGDAAAGCSPTIQQGVATALADSRCLADVLAMQSVDQALITYKDRREGAAARVIRYSDAQILDLQSMQNWMNRSLRDLKVRTFGPPNVQMWKKLATSRRF